jgi:hypothetical protein
MVVVVRSTDHGISWCVVAEVVMNTTELQEGSDEQEGGDVCVFVGWLKSTEGGNPPGKAIRSDDVGYLTEDQSLSDGAMAGIAVGPRLGQSKYEVHNFESCELRLSPGNLREKGASTMRPVKVADVEQVEDYDPSDKKKDSLGGEIIEVEDGSKDVPASRNKVVPNRKDQDVDEALQKPEAVDEGVGVGNHHPCLQPVRYVGREEPVRATGHTHICPH